MKYAVGKERIYNKEFLKAGYADVVRWDVIDINVEQELYIEFVSTNSKYGQGIRLAVDCGEGFVEANGYKAKEIQVWEDTWPKKIKIKCASSEGKLSVYNLFDVGEKRGGVKSLADSSGMIVERKGNKITYKCHDEGFQPDFTNLIFTIELL